MVIVGTDSYKVMDDKWLFKGVTCLKKSFLKPTDFQKISTSQL